MTSISDVVLAVVVLGGGVALAASHPDLAALLLIASACLLAGRMT